MTPIVCRVEGFNFHTYVEVLTTVEGSFFQAALSKEWNLEVTGVLEIARDCTHFQYVLDYLRLGHLLCDTSGHCNIPRESLLALRVEADFYGLPLLMKEIKGLLMAVKQKEMRYFISCFSLDSSPDSGGLELKEYRTYKEALAVYNKVKESYADYLKPDHPRGEDNEGDGDGDEMSFSGSAQDDDGHCHEERVVVREHTDWVTGKVNFELFEDGDWKRPCGTQLLCIPITQDVAEDGALYSCCVRTTPESSRTYEW
jgi:hypothetical protein